MPLHPTPEVSSDYAIPVIIGSFGGTFRYAFLRLTAT